MSMADISREARTWEAQLCVQGLRPRDAYQIAQREAGWQGWALAEPPWQQPTPSHMVRAAPQPRSPHGPGRACRRGQSH